MAMTSGSPIPIDGPGGEGPLGKPWGVGPSACRDRKTELDAARRTGSPCLHVLALDLTK